MIEHYCTYHLPHPVLMEQVPDGRPEVVRTDGCCKACMKRVLTEYFSRRRAAGGPTSFPRRAPFLGSLCN